MECSVVCISRTVSAGGEGKAPTHYDVVINTDVLTPVEAVEMILPATRRPG